MFKVLEEICTPTKGSKYSACIDLYSAEDVVIGAGETVKIPLGVCIDEEEMFVKLATSHYFGTYKIGQEPEFNEHCYYMFNDFIKSHYLSIHPRSSIGVKGLIIPNGMGIIDLDYRDEIMLILHNPTKIAYEIAEDSSGHVECDDNFKINKGDKIAQVMLCEHKTYLLGVDTDEERTGGFGSTDKGEK